MTLVAFVSSAVAASERVHVSVQKEEQQVRKGQRVRKGQKHVKVPQVHEIDDKFVHVAVEKQVFVKVAKEAITNLKVEIIKVLKYHHCVNVLFW